jgi:hypothetical protein
LCTRCLHIETGVLFVFKLQRSTATQWHAQR